MKCTCYGVCDIVLFLALTMHQNKRFQDRIFKNFLGRGSPSPLPRPLPPFFLGLRPRFGLRPQYSGASRPRLSTKNLSKFMKLCCAPPNGKVWIRPCLCLNISHYRLLPNHQHFFTQDAQTISVYHASPHQPILYKIFILCLFGLLFICFGRLFICFGWLFICFGWVGLVVTMMGENLSIKSIDFLFTY